LLFYHKKWKYSDCNTSGGFSTKYTLYNPYFFSLKLNIFGKNWLKIHKNLNAKSSIFYVLISLCLAYKRRGNSCLLLFQLRTKYFLIVKSNLLTWEFFIIIELKNVKLAYLTIISERKNIKSPWLNRALERIKYPSLLSYSSYMNFVLQMFLCFHSSK